MRKLWLVVAAAAAGVAIYYRHPIRTALQAECRRLGWCNDGLDVENEPLGTGPDPDGHLPDPENE